METLTEFGLVLGASFEGFEEEMTKILQSIEERRNTRDGKSNVRKQVLKYAGKGSKELKNLISTINYEAGSSRNKGTRRGRGMPLYLCS
jgi:hypothetical protein